MILLLWRQSFNWIRCSVLEIILDCPDIENPTRKDAWPVPWPKKVRLKIKICEVSVVSICKLALVKGCLKGPDNLYFFHVTKLTYQLWPFG